MYNIMLLVLFIFCWTCVMGTLGENEEVLDLTHTVEERTIFFPGNPPYNFSNAFRLPGTEGHVAEGNAFQTAEHSGTHVDAPRHFCPKGKVMDQLRMDRLIGPGIVLDLKAEAEENRDFEVTKNTLLDWEKQNGVIPEGAIVLFNFGWEKFWPNREKVFGSRNVTDPLTFHFPGLSPDAAKWITAHRNIHAVGADTPSLDFGQSRLYETHVTLLCDNEVVILENVANLDSMPPTGTRVYIGALKIARGSGTPVRLFAVPSDAPTLERVAFFNHFCVLLAFASFPYYM